MNSYTLVLQGLMADSDHNHAYCGGSLGTTLGIGVGSTHVNIFLSGCVSLHSHGTEA